MKKLVLVGWLSVLTLVLTSVSHAGVADLSCVFTQKLRTAQGKMLDEAASAELVQRSTGEEVLEAELSRGALIVKKDGLTDLYRLTIVEPPSYTDGVVALLKPDATSSMVLFKIRDSLVLKAECQLKNQTPAKR